MERPPHPTRHVVVALRRALAAGELLPGQPLPIGSLSEHFGLSATPVREALARLSGEGLVVGGEGGGYACAPMEVASLIGLRRLERLLLEAALTGSSISSDALARRFQAREPCASRHAEDTYWLLGEIAAAGGDVVRTTVFAVVSARLGAVRRVEAAFSADELFGLARAVAEGTQAGRRALDAYFERRRGREAETCDLISRLHVQHPQDWTASSVPF